mmetsp:Transcript_7813/g.30837  ORF Transcript_7813/g.30837 Transcript_7813/m.30837 type:complete len:293 (+) Transcript_7813:1457-2335(+)
MMPQSRSAESSSTAPSEASSARMSDSVRGGAGATPPSSPVGRSALARMRRRRRPDAVRSAGAPREAPCCHASATSDGGFHGSTGSSERWPAAPVSALLTTPWGPTSSSSSSLSVSSGPGMLARGPDRAASSSCLRGFASSSSSSSLSSSSSSSSSWPPSAALSSTLPPPAPPAPASRGADAGVISISTTRLTASGRSRPRYARTGAVAAPRSTPDGSTHRRLRDAASKTCTMVLVAAPGCNSRRCNALAKLAAVPVAASAGSAPNVARKSSSAGREPGKDATRSKSAAERDE